MLSNYLLDIIYLIASVTFVIGLKMLSGPQTARRGNLVAAFGMGIAVAGTILLHQGEVAPLVYGMIFGAIAIGSIIGWVAAKRVKMTAMPEMVSLFNGMGGACAALISLLEFHHNVGNPSRIGIIMAGMVIGSVSFSGSIIAFLKLNGTMRKSVRLPKYNIINAILMLATIAVSVWLTASGTDSMGMLLFTFALALLYGVLFVMPIGGADMPVVISLLNSFTGLAAAFGGFLYDNQVMLTGGILVGSAGTLLTLAMCTAMNRPLFNVVFGAFGESAAAGGGTSVQGTIKDISVSMPLS